MARRVKLGERFNFWACFGESVGWMVSLNFLSLDTILPSFIRQLTPSRWVVALLPALANLGMYLPPLLVANALERRPTVRGYVFTVALLERVPLLLLGPLVLWLWPRAGAAGLLGALFACVGLHSLLVGCNFPAYTALIERSVPVAWRGRLYGWSSGLGGLLGIGAAALAQHYLAHFNFPIGYARCFLLGAGLMTLSVLLLGFVRETPPEFLPERRALETYLRQALRLLHTDRSFAAYVLSQILQSSSVMALAFYTVCGLDRFQAPKEVAAQFLMVASVTRIFSNPVWGHWIDVWGNRRVLLWGTGFLVVTPLVALTAPSLTLYHAVFAFSNLALSATGLAAFTWIMETAPRDQVPTYISLTSTLLAPFRLALPLLGGALAETLGYEPVFLLVAGLTLLSFPFVKRMREPRKEGGSRPPRPG